MDEDGEHEEEEAAAGEEEEEEEEDSDSDDGNGGGAAAGASAAKSAKTPARVFSQTIPSVTEEDSQATGGSSAGAGGPAAAAAAAAHSARKAEADQRRSDRIDYDALERQYRDAAESGDPPEETVSARLEGRIHALDQELQRLTPNLKAAAQLEELDAKLKAENAEYEAAKARQVEAARRHSAAVEARTRLLTDAHAHVAAEIDGIYKDLTRSAAHPMGGKASLSLENPEAPFEAEAGGGVRFNVMPPGKRYRDLEQLSGGEKTVAALALLFALHSFRPSPFLVMDEVDAALDNVNVHKVATYIRRRSVAVPAAGSGGAAAAAGVRRSRSGGGAGAGDAAVGALASDMQSIVISLKDGFYDKATGLIGIYRDAAADSSRSLTLDLCQFAAAAGDVGGGGASVAGSGSVAGSAPRSAVTGSSAGRA